MQTEKFNPLDRTTLKIKLLDKNAVAPSYAHDGDIGLDVTATGVEYDADLDMYVYHTGIASESFYGIGIFGFLRSSNRRTDAYLCNHVGVIDSAIYRGEILFCFKNRTSLEVRALMEAHRMCIRDIDAVKATLNPMDYAPYKVGDRVGQLILFKYVSAEIVVCDELSDSERGTGGFGSTGH